MAASQALVTFRITSFTFSSADDPSAQPPSRQRRMASTSKALAFQSVNLFFFGGRFSCLMCAKWVLSVPPRNIAMLECRMISDVSLLLLCISWIPWVMIQPEFCWADLLPWWFLISLYLQSIYWVHDSVGLEKFFSLLSSWWKWTCWVSLIKKIFALLIRSPVSLVSVKFNVEELKKLLAPFGLKRTTLNNYRQTQEGRSVV